MTTSTVELHRSAGQSMLSDYWTSLLLTRRSDGSFTLKVHAGGDGTRRAKFCSKPFRTAEGFVRAVSESQDFDSSSSYSQGDIHSWLESIARLDPEFARKLTLLEDS